MLFNWDRRIYDSQKLAYGSSTLFIITIKVLFYLTTQLNLLPVHSLQNLSRVLKFFSTLVCKTIVKASDICYLFSIFWFYFRKLELETSNLLESINIFMRLYSLFCSQSWYYSQASKFSQYRYYLYILNFIVIVKFVYFCLQDR